MARDHGKLRVFHLSDDVVPEVYRCTKDFPTEERYGLQAQIRRAAVSVPTNIVEGCARRTERDYLHFLDVALGSAAEVRSLLGLACRLGMLPQSNHNARVDRYGELIRALQALIASFRSPKPDA